MPLLTMLIFGIGPSVAKALLKSVLQDHPLIGDIAPDLLNMLRDKAKGERTQREDSGRIAAIGASVATMLNPLFDDAVLTDAERATVLREVLLTLGQTDAEQMVESRVDPRRLREALLASRLDATKATSACKSAVKVGNTRIGWESRSRGTATTISSLPISRPAALGWTQANSSS